MAVDSSSKRIGDVHPLGHLLDEWAEWVAQSGSGDLSIEYDDEEDTFLVHRNGRQAVLYIADIDGDFYGEAQALFAESEVGLAPTNLNWAQTLRFSGDELVLSRISLSEREEHLVLVVEGAAPLSKVTDFELFDLLVREVSTIGRDLRKQLGGVMLVPPSQIEEGAETADEEAEDSDDKD